MAWVGGGKTESMVGVGAGAARFRSAPWGVAEGERGVQRRGGGGEGGGGGGGE